MTSRSEHFSAADIQFALELNFTSITMQSIRYDYTRGVTILNYF